MKGFFGALRRIFRRGYQVYTIGYQGRSLEMFMNELKKNDIKLLIDTRHTPLSRKPGFSKNALKEKVEENGIVFISLPEAGAPKNLRDYLKETRDYEMFFEKYKEHITSLGSFEKLKKHVNGERVCIMCFERNANECHRSVLAEKLESDIGVQVTHIA